MQVLKVVSRLLDGWRNREYRADLGTGDRQRAELPRTSRSAARYAGALCAGDLMDAQAYGSAVRPRTVPFLHLFEHVHRGVLDRGGGHVDLLDVYRSNGFELDAPTA